MEHTHHVAPTISMEFKVASLQNRDRLVSRIARGKQSGWSPPQIFVGHLPHAGFCSTHWGCFGEWVCTLALLGLQLEVERQCRGQHTKHQMNGLTEEQCSWLESQARYPKYVPKVHIHAWLFPHDLISCTLFLNTAAAPHVLSTHLRAFHTASLVLPPESSCRETPAPCALTLYSLHTPPRGNHLLSEFWLSLNFPCFVSACFTRHHVSETHTRCRSRQHLLLVLDSACLSLRASIWKW